MSDNHIIVSKQKLKELQLNLLSLRDYIQYLECTMTLLLIPFEGSPRFNNANFLEYLISLATNEFSPERCQEFIEAVEEARRLVKEALDTDE